MKSIISSIRRSNNSGNTVRTRNATTFVYESIPFTMGNLSIQIKLPTNYSSDELKRIISKKYRGKNYSYQIEKKSLDARNKSKIHWQASILISSNEIKNESVANKAKLEITHKKRNETVIVVGSGPAGFFAAHTLQLAGFKVKIIERGSAVKERGEAIDKLESTSIFDSKNNYAFGEGGAGTFSDGKLTSRSKHISKERNFILQEYVKAGAPEEILYMAHPHVGTDNLKIMVANLRKTFTDNGGEFNFNTCLEDIVVKSGKIDKIVCNTGIMEADHFILAIGHSAYETYRMLIGKGIQFGTKNFAIGHRIEHPQKIINLAQWGREQIAGLKAAEYRLATKTNAGLPVYTFCMCPGGTVVPAAAYEEKSVVNGMSYYNRDGEFSNAGCVVGVHPDMLLGKKATALEILDWMDKMEESFYSFSSGYTIAANKVKDYQNKKASKSIGKVSYPLGIQAADLHNMLPDFVTNSISEGINHFTRKLKGFDEGVLMGFESKTSSPIQIQREKDGRCSGFDNLYFVGEGSGFTGGIISSAADGVKCAMTLIG